MLTGVSRVTSAPPGTTDTYRAIFSGKLSAPAVVCQLLSDDMIGATMRYRYGAFVLANLLVSHAVNAGSSQHLDTWPPMAADPSLTLSALDQTVIATGYAPLTDCDRLAAYAHDPETVTVPVPFSQIDIVRALPACELSVAQYPETPRLEVLLARVLLKAGDPKKAEKWYRAAAKRGHATGQHSLARLLHEKREFAEAAVWLERAARQGFAASQGLLGDYLAAGRGVPRNLEQAVTWWRLAAEQGDPVSQLSLGNAYLNGNGVTADREIAFKWYLVASQNNHRPALKRLDWAIKNSPTATFQAGVQLAESWQRKSWSDLSHMLAR